MPLFGANGLLRWIKIQKRKPLNRCSLMNARLNSFYFPQPHAQIFEGVGKNYKQCAPVNDHNPVSGQLICPFCGLIRRQSFVFVLRSQNSV